MSVRADSGSGMSFGMTFDPLGFITGMGNIATAMNEQAETSRHNEEAEDIARAQNTLAENTLNWNKENALRTFEYNKWLNETQMSREDKAIQRRVADLRAAGLSPLLAAGSAASATAGSQLNAPQVSQANFAQPDYKNSWSGVRQGLQDAYSGILQGIKTYKDSQLTDAQISNIASQTEKTQAETKVANAEAGYIDEKLSQEAEARKAQIENTLSEIRHREHQERWTDTINSLEAEKRRIDNNMALHDWNIVSATDLSSQVALGGMQSELGKAFTDVIKFLKQDGYVLGNDGNGNFGIIKSAVEKIPEIGSDIVQGAKNLWDAGKSKFNEIFPNSGPILQPNGDVIINNGNNRMLVQNNGRILIDGKLINPRYESKVKALFDAGQDIPSAYFSTDVHNNGFSHHANTWRDSSGHRKF